MPTRVKRYTFEKMAMPPSHPMHRYQRMRVRRSIAKIPVANGIKRR